MARDTTIADRCREMGLRVIECAGWQTRGDDTLNGRGSVNHHTAGSSSGSTPSLDGVIHGFAGSAPGPLANALQSREPDGNDIIYVVAAGKANHAGDGGWHGLSGNSSVYGLEIEHNGTTPLPVGRQRIAAKFHAAMAKGRFDESMVCQHKEWAPNRKIDAATEVNGDQFRGWVKEYLSGSSDDGPEPPTKETDMYYLIQTESRGAKWYLVTPDRKRMWVDTQAHATELCFDLSPNVKCNWNQGNAQPVRWTETSFTNLTTPMRSGVDD